MWIYPKDDGFVIKAMFGNHSYTVIDKVFSTIGEARGQLMRWNYGIEKSPV